MSSASWLTGSTKPWVSEPQSTVTTSRVQVPCEPQPRRHVVLAEQLDHPLGGAGAGMHHGDAVALGEPAADVRHRALQVAAVGVGRPRRQRAGRYRPHLDVDVDADDLAELVAQRLPLAGRARVETFVVDPERAQRPPRQVAGEGVHADVGEGPVRRGAEVDGSGAAAGGRGPAGAEELLARRHQVVRPGPGALGVEHQHVGVGGHQVDEQLHLVDQHGRQRLHPLDGDPGGDLVGQLEQRGMRLPELPGPAAYVVGQQQLAARRRPETLDLLERALVRDRERRGSPRPRRPRTPPGAGAPRSAGRRRRCRHGPRTRRASRPGRRGCRRRPPAGGPRRPAAPRRRGAARRARGRRAP